MQSFVTKVDSTSPPTGNLTAAEFNQIAVELENLITESGQTLSGSNLFQILIAIGMGGRVSSLTDTNEAVIGDINVPDNSAGAITVDTPTTKFDKARFIVMQDWNQPYSTNSVILNRADSATIGDKAEDMTFDIDNSIVMFRYDLATDDWIPSIIGTVGAPL